MKLLRSLFTMTIPVFFCAVTLQAQSLAAGDIAFIGLYTSGGGGVGDAFTFITLKDLPEGTVIYFSDDGWNNGAWGGAPGEVHFTWLPPTGGVPIGTIVTITGGASQTVPGTPSIGTCSASFLYGTAWHYPTGEEILAYQSSAGARPASPTFIAGMLAYYNSSIYDITTKWCSTTAGFNQSASTLPDGLTNGVNCVSVFNATYNPTVANCRYTGSLSGTASAVRALINNDANWTRTSNSTFDITSAAFPAPSITADLPVELVSFEATAVNNKIHLKWHTATEANNYGFELERKSSADGWKKIGFVEGNGTTNAPNHYSFVDISGAGTFQYRLKQIDRDGTFEYSKTVEATAADAPTVFALLQNYPNPFNPTTTISFTVPSIGRATLKIFNALGQEVAALFNGEAHPGKYYRMRFNASGLASGIYISRLEHNGSLQLKKLTLMK